MSREPLSALQCATMQLLSQGMQLEGVAKTLGISESTARTHALRATAKLGAASRIEAVVIHQRVHRTCRAGDDERVALVMTRTRRG